MTHPPGFRARVLALFDDGYSYDEIERMTGCPPGTIASLCRSERKLNPTFGEMRKQKRAERALENMRHRRKQLQESSHG